MTDDERARRERFYWWVEVTFLAVTALGLFMAVAATGLFTYLIWGILWAS